MRMMKRASELARHPSRAFSHSPKYKHPVLDVFGLILLAFVTLTLASMLPDFVRYMKMRQM